MNSLVLMGGDTNYIIRDKYLVTNGMDFHEEGVSEKLKMVTDF